MGKCFSCNYHYIIISCSYSFIIDNFIEEIKLLLKYYSFELDDWQDNDWLLEVLKLFLDEEREVELNCWNDEIDAINLAINLGFRVIEIKQFLIRLSGTTDMLDLNKIVILKSFVYPAGEYEEENLLPFLSLFIKDEIFIEH